MTRYCLTCNRSFTSGSYKYKNCKECRNKSHNVKIVDKKQPINTATITTTTTYPPLQYTTTQYTPVLHSPPLINTSPIVVPPPIYTVNTPNIPLQNTVYTSTTIPNYSSVPPITYHHLNTYPQLPNYL